MCLLDMHFCIALNFLRVQMIICSFNVHCGNFLMTDNV